MNPSWNNIGQTQYAKVVKDFPNHPGSMHFHAGYLIIPRGKNKISSGRGVNANINI